MSMPIFANVNPNSKYKDQRQPHPFPVVFDLDHRGFHFAGGPGGQYRFSDLVFFIDLDGKQVPANTFAAGEQVDIFDAFLQQMKAQAQAGDLYPEWMDKTAKRWGAELNAIAVLARKNYVEEGE